MSAATSLHTTLLPGGAPRVVFLHGLFGQGKNLTAIAKGLAPEHGALLVEACGVAQRVVLFGAGHVGRAVGGRAATCGMIARVPYVTPSGHKRRRLP